MIFIAIIMIVNLTEIDMKSICFVLETVRKKSYFVDQYEYITKCGNKIVRFSTEDIPRICNQCKKKLRDENGYFVF